MTYTIKSATAITGTLSKPSKMPGYGYGLSAEACQTGSKLRQVEGTPCSGCYALRNNYQYPSVKKAHAKRLDAIKAPRWVEAMVFMITKRVDATDPYFRWHDSGDVQSLEHLEKIAEIARRTPDIQHWLPTQERGYVKAFLKAHGEFPANLTVRVSASKIDGKAPAFANTSTVWRDSAPQGHECPARHQGNACKDCRACWDKGVANVSYHVH